MGLSRYASEGATVGVDISVEVMQKASQVAAEASVPTQRLGGIMFEEGNILGGANISRRYVRHHLLFSPLQASVAFAGIAPPNSG